MKAVAFLFVGLAGLAAPGLRAETAPHGAYLELHSCEVYAGGCIVSSQATLEGRYLARIWQFSGGSVAGNSLAGLPVAVLQASADNLAANPKAARRTVVYLPAAADAKQRAALVQWLQSGPARLKRDSFQARIAPLRFERTAEGYTFSAGDFITLQTGPLPSCDVGGCGESLWYTPQSPTTAFTVAVNRSAQICEPWLDIRWRDANQRSVFVGTFDQGARAKSVYVTAADLCSPSGVLF